MMKTALTSIAVVTLALVPAAVQAASFSIAPDARGFRSPVLANTVSANASYLVGNTVNLGDTRNFFQFRLPTFAGKVISARLRLDTGVVVFDAQPVMTYQLTSLAELPSSSAGVSSLGTGTLYGARSFTVEDANKVVSIDLNNAGIAALTSGGTLRVGGRLVDVQIDSTPAFGLFSQTGDKLVSLDFTTAVPEPASWAMLIAGFGLAGAALRRRRAAVA